MEIAKLAAEKKETPAEAPVQKKETPVENKESPASKKDSLAQASSKKHHKKKHHKKHQDETETQSLSEGQFVNDLYDGKHSDGLANGAKKHDYSEYTVNHYDDLDAKHKDQGDAAEGVSEPAAKKGGVPAELAKTAAAKASLVQKEKVNDKKDKFVGDLYDGKKSDGLENGAKKLDEKKIDDHYDTKTTESKSAAQVKNATNSTQISTAQVENKA